MLVADENANVLKTVSWVQHPAPIFPRNHANGVYGPGNHSFFHSLDGTEDWMRFLYHGNTSPSYTESGSDTRAQIFHGNRMAYPTSACHCP